MDGSHADPELAGRLRALLAHGEDPGGNAIGGQARVAGPVVQARAIHGDVHLHTHPAQAEPPMPKPSQLPPPPAHFTGRDGELAELATILAERRDRGVRTLVVLVGAAGVGKTSLALWWLRSLAEQFPDGQLYADLCGYSPGGVVTPEEVQGRFLRALGVHPEHVPGDLVERRRCTAR